MSKKKKNTNRQAKTNETQHIKTKDLTTRTPSKWRKFQVLRKDK